MLEAADARGSEAEFNLVKRRAIKSVRQRNNSLSGGDAVTCDWDVCSELKMANVHIRRHCNLSYLCACVQLIRRVTVLPGQMRFLRRYR